MGCEIHPSETFGTIIICMRGQRKRKTWDCECQKKQIPNAQKVCPRCGLYRDGCPRCDSDLVPAKTFGGEVPTFVRGVPRLHVCSGNQSITGKPCGYEVTA